MLDIRLISSEPDAVRAALARRGVRAAAAVDRVLELDAAGAALTAELEELRAEQNRASRGRKGAPTPEEREQIAALAARGRALTDQETSFGGRATPRCCRCRTCRPGRARRRHGAARGRRGRRVAAATTSSSPAR